LRVEASLLDYENRIKIGYQIRDIDTGERMTKGFTVQVAVDSRTRELQFVSPAIVFTKIEKACAK
jgi:acyl-CoA thioester hydrolase